MSADNHEDIDWRHWLTLIDDRLVGAENVQA